MELTTKVAIEFKGRVEEYTIAELKEEHPLLCVDNIENLLDDIFSTFEGAEGVEIDGYLYSK